VAREDHRVHTSPEGAPQSCRRSRSACLHSFEDWKFVQVPQFLSKTGSSRESHQFLPLNLYALIEHGTGEDCARTWPEPRGAQPRHCAAPVRAASFEREE
jgi:hypothetical protein